MIKAHEAAARRHPGHDAAIDRRGTVADAVLACGTHWLAFVHHRLQRDLELAHRYATCSSTDEAVKATVEFWSQAALDYQDGLARLGEMQLDAWRSAVTYGGVAASETWNPRKGGLAAAA